LLRYVQQTVHRINGVEFSGPKVAQSALVAN
jgi:hypothetical protein